MQNRQRRAGPRLVERREMGIDQRGLQRGMAKILGDEAQRNALLQQMRGVAMPQRVDGGRGGQPTGGPRQAKGVLHGGD